MIFSVFLPIKGFLWLRYHLFWGALRSAEGVVAAVRGTRWERGAAVWDRVEGFILLRLWEH